LPLFPVPAQSIVAKDGVSGLFTRGLTTRIAANGLQNICFTVLWNLVSKLGHHDNDTMYMLHASNVFNTHVFPMSTRCIQLVYNTLASWYGHHVPASVKQLMNSAQLVTQCPPQLVT
jgi:hypothetical protein